MFVLFFPKQQRVKRVVLMQQRFPDISKPSKHVPGVGKCPILGILDITL